MTLVTTRVSLPVPADGPTVAARKPVAPRPAGRPPRIHGLDALRAVAVLAVMAFHFFPAVLPGGFIGVDVFFVLSGFLITTLLVRERVRTTRVSLRAFWARRARRLLPALVVVVVTCTALAGVLGGDVLVGIRSQVAGALTFSSNWVYIAQGATYSDDLSPQLFANFWSLAVEEQFYLLWPLVLVAIYAARRSRTVGLLTTGTIGVGSAVLMVVTFHVGEDASRVYYGTDTHLFGLMAGAFFALWFAPRTAEGTGTAAGSWTPRATTTGWRWTTAVVGLVSGAVLVVLALSLGTGSPVTYRGGLLLASLATVGVIAVVVRGQRVARLVEKGPLRWVGRRSYGLYLWHWPLVVLVAQVLDGSHPGRASEPLVAATATVVTFVAAGLSYHFVEKPVLDRGLRAVAADVATRVRDRVDAAWVERHGGWHTRGRRARLAASTALVVLVVGAVGAAFVRQPAHSALEAEILRGQEIADATRQGSSGAAGVDVPSPDPSPTAGPPVSADPAVPVPAVPTEPAPAPAAPAAPAPPPATGPPPGDQVTIIGDSVTLISAEALQAALPGVYIDAIVSRQMKTTAEVATALRAAGALRPYVVLSLATNSTVTDRVMEEAVAAIGPDHQIVLVTGYGDRPWIGPTNDQLRAAAERHPNVVVADWQSALAAAPDGVGKDGVHPQGAGRDLYARTLADALAASAASAGVVTPPGQ